METDEEIYPRYRLSDDDADLETLLTRHREGLLLFMLGFIPSPTETPLFHEGKLFNTLARYFPTFPAFLVFPRIA